MLVSWRTVVEISILLKTARRRVQSLCARKSLLVLSERLTDGRGSIVMAGTKETDMSAKRDNSKADIEAETVVIGGGAGKL
jgi:hypothetical protein